MGLTVDALLDQPDWHGERRKLRAILLDCGLAETVKWGKLCYMLDSANVAIIYGMKHSCAVGFFKGALLADPAGLLEAPGEHSQSMRRIHFTSLAEVEENETAIRAFTAQAIALERQGARIEPREDKLPDRPAELTALFAADHDLARAFDALTPGRQRAYLIHFTSAAQPATRLRRIEKHLPAIRAGKGMHDR